MRNILSTLAILLVSVQVSATSTVTIEGELQGLTPDHFELSDGRKVYSIAKNRLGVDQAEKLAKFKNGEKLTLRVPFDAVLGVKAPKSQ